MLGAIQGSGWARLKVRNYQRETYQLKSTLETLLYPFIFLKCELVYESKANKSSESMCLAQNVVGHNR